MEEMNLNGALLIKQPHYIPSLRYSLCFSVATHLSRFLRNTHTHTLVQSRVCSRAGGLRGLILELARYSHKTDRPTNYPKNYNILMFALTAMFTRTVWVCECVFVCACLTIFLFFGVCVRVLESVYYADSWRWSPACRIERTDVWCSSLFLYCSAYPSHTMKSKS